MSILSLVCVSLFSLTAIVVGLRLIRLSIETGKTPERLLGMVYFSACGIGFPMVVAGGRLFETHLLLATFLHHFGNLCITFGIGGFFVFTALVFRPGALWARLLAIAGCVVIAVDLAGLLWAWYGVDRADMMRRSFPFSLTNMLVLGLGYAWMGGEGLRYYRMMRRRFALGIGDPITANRFLLWAIAGIVASAATLVNVTVVSTAGGAAQNPMTVTVTSMNGLLQSLLLFLIFMPPQSYLAWVAGARRPATVEA